MFAAALYLFIHLWNDVRIRLGIIFLFTISSFQQLLTYVIGNKLIRHYVNLTMSASQSAHMFHSIDIVGLHDLFAFIWKVVSARMFHL